MSALHQCQVGEKKDEMITGNV